VSSFTTLAPPLWEQAIDVDLVVDFHAWYPLRYRARPVGQTLIPALLKSKWRPRGIKWRLQQPWKADPQYPQYTAQATLTSIWNSHLRLPPPSSLLFRLSLPSTVLLRYWLCAAHMSISPQEDILAVRHYPSSVHIFGTNHHFILAAGCPRRSPNGCDAKSKSICCQNLQQVRNWYIYLQLVKLLNDIQPETIGYYCSQPSDQWTTTTTSTYQLRCTPPGRFQLEELSLRTCVHSAVAYIDDVDIICLAIVPLIHERLNLCTSLASIDQ